MCGAGPRWGSITLQSGSSSPVSSNTMTPLQSRLQPCSGTDATIFAASRSVSPADGQGGWCWHNIEVPQVGIGVVYVALLMFSDARYYGQRHISVHVTGQFGDNPLFV